MRKYVYPCKPQDPAYFNRASYNDDLDLKLFSLVGGTRALLSVS